MSGPALPENRFAVEFLGRPFRLHRQTAYQRLSARAGAAELLPWLTRLGLRDEEARALAHNCVLLWQTLEGPDALSGPREVLDRFTLGQIAELCDRYWRREDLPFGGWDEGGRLEREEAADGL